MTSSRVWPLKWSLQLRLRDCCLSGGLTAICEHRKALFHTTRQVQQCRLHRLGETQQDGAGTAAGPPLGGRRRLQQRDRARRRRRRGQGRVRYSVRATLRRLKFRCWALMFPFYCFDAELLSAGLVIVVVSALFTVRRQCCGCCRRSTRRTRLTMPPPTTTRSDLFRTSCAKRR